LLSRPSQNRACKHGSERGVTTTQEEVVMSRDHIVAACSEVYP